MPMDDHTDASTPPLPFSTYRPGQGTIYNCPDHGPMSIDWSGGAQSYECVADDCGYTHHPDRDTGWTADVDVDLDADCGTAATPSPSAARSGPAPTHPAALARAFDPPGTPATAPPASAVRGRARAPEPDGQTLSTGSSRRR